MLRIPTAFVDVKNLQITPFNLMMGKGARCLLSFGRMSLLTESSHFVCSTRFMGLLLCAM